MTTTINASTSSGLVNTADTSGVLALQTAGTTAVTIDASQNVTIAKPVVLSGSTSGAITLAAPAVAGTNTITFPASTGTVVTSGSPQSGGVIQVVNSTYSNYISTNSTTNVSTNLSATITPKFSTSKILVIASMLGVGSDTSTNCAHFEIYRAGSSLTYWEDYIAYGLTTGGYSTSISYLDSPATTSSTAYAIYWRRVGPGSGTVLLNNYESGGNRTVSTITLMEIAA